MNIKSPTNICIFSRNRPLQLQALLRSVHTFASSAGKITVLYRYDDEYMSALEEVKLSHSDCDFIEDNNFKQQVISFLESSQGNCFFLVDDIVFRRLIPMDIFDNILENNPDILTFSLRLGLHLNYCYPVDSFQKIPDGQVQHGFFLWPWRTGEHDWGYPFSVDGHIFRSKQLLSYIRHLEFTTPNSFEAEMQKIPHQFALPNLVICNVESSLFNNPLNRVQNAFQNRTGDVTAEQLLAKWQAGLEIDIDKLTYLIPDGAHYITELPMRERK